MSKQHSFSAKYGFTTASDFLHRGTSDESNDPPVFTDSPGNVDLGKKPHGRAWSRSWLLVALALLAPGGASWCLGGNEFWGWTATLGALLLILLAVAGLKASHALQPRHWLAFGWLILCWASWTVAGVYWPITEVRIEPALAGGTEPEASCRLRVIYCGQVRVELDRCRKCSFRFRGRFQREHLQIEMLTPTGWTRRSFQGFGNIVSLNEIALTRLYIDNRDHGEVKLACGEWQACIAAGGKEQLRVPAPPASVHCPLTMDGKEIGSLEGDDLLVDTLGTRSYEFRTVLYEGVLNPFLLGPPAPRPCFVWGHLHKLPGKIDFFLEPAPQEIRVPTLYGLALDPLTRTQLQAIAP
jgi:hypothetical protein